MIHNSSVISKKAKIGANVKIGPFCSIGDFVQLDEGVELISHVHIEGNTTIGKEAIIYPFALTFLLFFGYLNYRRKV